MHEEDVKEDVKEDINPTKSPKFPTNPPISTTNSPNPQQSPKNQVIVGESPKKQVMTNSTYSEANKQLDEIDKNWFIKLIFGRAGLIIQKNGMMDNEKRSMEKINNKGNFKRVFGFENNDTQSEIKTEQNLTSYVKNLINRKYIWGKDFKYDKNKSNSSSVDFYEQIGNLLTPNWKNDDDIDWNDDTKKYISQLAQAIHEALKEAKIFEIISQESIQDTQINETYQDFFKNDELLSNDPNKTQRYDGEKYKSLKEKLKENMNIALSISEKLMPCIKDWVNEDFRLEFDEELGKHNIEGQFIENKPDLNGMMKYWVNLSNNKIGENFIPTIVHEFAHKMEYNLDVKNLMLLYRHLLARMKTSKINEFKYSKDNKKKLFLLDLYIPNYKEVAKEMKINDAHLLYCCNATNAFSNPLFTQSTEFLSTTAEFMSQEEKAEILINNDPMRVALFFYFSNKDIFNKISDKFDENFNSTLTSSQDNASKISLERLLHIDITEDENTPLVDNDNLENLENENWFLSFIKSLLCCCTNTD